MNFEHMRGENISHKLKHMKGENMRMENIIHKCCQTFLLDSMSDIQADSLFSICLSMYQTYSAQRSDTVETHRCLIELV